MFMSGLSESTQTHVHLRNVDAATLQIIITYAYTGNLAISDSTVEPLYETACFLQVSAVKDKEKEQPVLISVPKSSVVDLNLYQSATESSALVVASINYILILYL